ncbi:MAG: 4Fe-4S binding protein [Clostridiaceae bacterium]|nr:4Fe-4S binding protein [Clostridiaceae bacterium]
MNMKNSEKKLIVRTDRCPSNHPCPAIRVCSVNALSQRGYNAPTVNMDVCVRCGRCVKYCPMQALVLE